MKVNKPTHWERMALTALLEELDAQQNAITMSILKDSPHPNSKDVEPLIEDWSKSTKALGMIPKACLMICVNLRRLTWQNW
ncbi:MAG: hypothetical protein IPP67_04440 [Rhodospirillaceae bacterium]|nr:hypothetical protein [Rhodospirillaceae bacterium]